MQNRIQHYWSVKEYHPIIVEVVCIGGSRFYLVPGEKADHVFYFEYKISKICGSRKKALTSPASVASIQIYTGMKASEINVEGISFLLIMPLIRLMDGHGSCRRTTPENLLSIFRE